MTCNEEFYAGIGHITDAYKRVCMFNEELHADLEKYRAENAKLRELLAKAGELIVIAGWPNVERDEMASAVMHDICELGVD